MLKVEIRDENIIEEKDKLLLKLLYVVQIIRNGGYVYNVRELQIELNSMDGESGFCEPRDARQTN